MSAEHAMKVSPPTSASVDVLTAEVRTVVVGNRQVTLSVYRQLDYCPVEDMEPWGRVRAAKDAPGNEIELIGRRRGDGTLVASSVTDRGLRVSLGDAPEYSRYVTILPATRDYSFALVKQGDYTAEVWVRGDRGRGRQQPQAFWVSNEAEEQVIDLATQKIAERVEERAFADQIRALPLIVLAGLR